VASHRGAAGKLARTIDRGSAPRSLQPTFLASARQLGARPPLGFGARIAAVVFADRGALLELVIVRRASGSVTPSQSAETLNFRVSDSSHQAPV
jgi:hypothetical protein